MVFIHSCLPTKSLHAPLLSLILAPCPAISILKMLSVDNKLSSSLLCGLPHSPISISPLFHKWTMTWHGHAILEAAALAAKLAVPNLNQNDINTHPVTTTPTEIANSSS
jgi:hypothetical protein